jgi:site-specific recombinase XerD
VQKGVDLYRVQRWLGHSSPTLTQRYSHLRDDDLPDAGLALVE